MAHWSSFGLGSSRVFGYTAIVSKARESGSLRAHTVVAGRLYLTTAARIPWAPDSVGSGDSSGQDAPMPESARYIARAGRLPDPRSTGLTQCADNRFPAVVRRPGRRR
ncbi:hypothetical protein [uncultured Bifidobacterium sp.]|uniref:hypothetical protein n=1 Tax=uncultured Bifidobacterium sp. TaxID=165187 RepID=UPI002582B7CE|nr:hypothetical protein [uncultured Bifidobacterium sp.]